MLLLYSLMSAYTTQGSSLVATIGSLEGSSKFDVALAAIIFTLIFGTLMFSYRVSDYANRAFVILKFVFFAVAVVIMLLYINTSYLSRAPLSFSAFIFAWPILLPSFGFHNIIPVLYEYQTLFMSNNNTPMEILLQKIREVSGFLIIFSKLV
ncbi:aromatic amino acid transport family protein [Francisella noatunensis]